ncbi:MAG: hypothetical protein HY722_06400 [Planctomycetes bacterium]|nr:hypothetical protein [Planctomycetota bacterium]
MNPLSADVPLHALSWAFYLSESRRTPFQYVGGVTLDRPIEARRMDASLEAACRRYPHYTWVVREVPQGAVWRPSGRRPRVRTDPGTLGRPFRLGLEPGVRAYCLGRDLLLEVHHSLTDAQGMVRLADRMLADYLGLAPHWGEPDEGFDARDPLLALLAGPAPGRPPRRRSLPYLPRPLPGARRRTAALYVLDLPRLGRVARGLGTGPQELCLALYCQALPLLARRADGRLPVNLMLPVDARRLLGFDTDFNGCGAAFLELDLGPASRLEDLLARIEAEKRRQVDAEVQRSTLRGLARATRGLAFRYLPMALKRTLASLVGEAITERTQTEVVSLMGLRPFRGPVGRHIEKVYGLPAVKHTRNCSLGMSGQGDRFCLGFHQTAASPLLQDVVLGGLRRLDPGCVLEGPLGLPPTRAS